MIKIITTEQAKALDEYTIREEPIPEVELVERAAKAFAEEFMRRFGKENRVVVFAGQGNNGADALAIARILQNKAYKKVETFLLNPPTGRQCSETCKEHQQRLLRSYPEGFREVTRQFNPPPLHPGDVVIDGLFGSGLNRPLAGGFAALVDYINRSAATVVAVDLPSGLFDRDNRENPAEGILRAKVTLTFAFPKLSFFLPENEAFVGEWQVIDIGLHPKAVAQTPTSFYQITPEDLAGAFPPRRKFAHKGLYGHALLLAGSRGKMGAALLAAKACLRSGAGRLTAHIPHGGDTALQTAIPEAMLSLDAHPNCVSQQPPTTPYTAIALGPGLGSDPATGAVLEAILRHESRPLILDADALNLIARNPEWLALIPPQSILTPHPKEFDRLAGASASGYERLMKARNFAMEHSLILVLKGAHTASCLPDGTVCFNTSGNPGMATPGSGDVLTGILLGLLASGHPPREAAIGGVWLHGTAGDLAAKRQSEESMLAGDLVEELGKAFKQALSPTPLSGKLSPATKE